MFGGTIQSNLTAAARQGTTVTASGTIHTKGAYTELIASLNADAYGFFVELRSVMTSNAVTGLLVDIAKGAAAAETVFAPNLHGGAAGPSAGDTSHGPKHYFVPCFVASGTRIAARCQALIVSDTVQVIVRAVQSPVVSLTLGSATTAYGVDAANSRGTSVTPASGSFGSWTEIGTTSADHNAWGVGYGQLADTSIAATGVLIEIGHGPNSGAVTSIGVFDFNQFTSEGIGGGMPLLYSKSVSSGDKVWARIASGEIEARDVIIYGGTATAPAGGGGGGGPRVIAPRD